MARNRTFLGDGACSKYILGGTLLRPLIAGLQSGGKFSMASIEGSSYHKNSVFGDHRGIKFKDVHHCVQVVDGYIDFTARGSTTRLAVRETSIISTGSEFSFKFANKFAKTYLFCNGRGLIELMTRAWTHITARH
jgi:hypothetical protein